MVLKARIRDGDNQRQQTQKSAGERTKSPGRAGVRRQQQLRPQGPEDTATPEATSAGDLSNADSVELRVEREQTARLRDEVARVRKELAEAHADVAQANERERQQAALRAAPPDTPPPTPQAQPQEARASGPISAAARLEQCETRLDVAVAAEEAALNALTDDAQGLIDATSGEKGLFMRLHCAGWVACRTSQTGDWERRWLTVAGDAAELRTEPNSADADAAVAGQEAAVA